MRLKCLTLGVLALAIAAMSWTRAATPAAIAYQAGPQLTSIGPLTFGPDGTLFAADTQAATIYALELGAQATAGTPGAQNVDAIDQKIAALLGTEPREIIVTDLAVHPRTRNAYVSVMRGQGTGSTPVLLRVDGAGKIDIVSLEGVKHSKVALPNAPAANAGPRNQRADSITDMAFADGTLYVSGLSNEEFASKLRALSYPFAAADAGTSVEIFHGNHGRLETRSPVYTFIPYNIDNKRHIIASYTCTPLVRFPVDGLRGSKVVGTTIAELGNRNRPLDMVLYRKDGREFLLMSNNSRGVMKIPTDAFGTAPAITTRVAAETGGVSFEPVASMKGIVQLDLLNERQGLVLARTDAGALNLQAVALP